MPMKHSQNNFAFIDAQNLYLSIKELGWKLDYKRFYVYLHEKYGVEKAYMFIGFLSLQSFRPYLRYVNDLHKKLEYKKKRPHKDETL